MINPKELRLGNWVEIFHNPYKVEAINTQFIEAVGYGRCWLKDVNPIKLTPEILIKNDWELDSKNKDCFYDGFTAIYEKSPNTFDIWVDNEKDLPEYVHYVHEFQNVLSVLGYGNFEIEL